MIALIDYGSGNIRSVHNALQHEGADVALVSTPENLAAADAVVLPGVGAFGDGVRGLQSRALWDPMREWMESGRPFLGICVGYQLLFEESEESPGVRGFGFFKGTVKRFSTAGLKVPQIGWNELEATAAGHTLWEGLPSASARLLRPLLFPGPERSFHRDLLLHLRRTLRRQRGAGQCRGRPIPSGEEPGGRPSHPPQFHPVNDW